MRRLLLGAAPIVVAALLVASCGSAAQSGSPSGHTAATATPPSGPPPTATPSAASSQPAVQRCQVSQLSLAVTDETASSGQLARVFILTNAGRSTCTLYGYPGLLMLDGAGKPVPTTVVREQPPSPEQRVTLAPDGTASFLAWWWNQNRYTTPCPLSQQVEVTPPNAYSHLTIPLSIQPCPDGTINVDPVFPGTTGSAGP